MNCTKEEYQSRARKCCDQCPAGSYVKGDCDGNKSTQCATCEHGSYTAVKNHLTKCHVCRECIDSIHQVTRKACTAKEDTQCGCETGFFCSNNDCDHCQKAKSCPPGEGVKVKATHRNDTVCAPCEGGTYSNETDFHSPCRAHTRCEDIGRLQSAPGTQTTDVTCGDFISQCPWMLPAGLWSGLVLTALVLFCLFCWMAKRRSYKAGSSPVPVTFIEMGPATRVSPLEFPLPSTEIKEHCQESCTINGCNLPLFEPENKISFCRADSLDSSLPITPLKASVSFAEPNHINKSNGYCSGNFLRTYSEPQEDEWCGT